MLRLSSRSRSVRRRKRTRIKPLLIISVKRTRLNMRSNKKPKELEKKKRGKSNVYVSCKRRLQIDRLRLMLSEQKEPSRRERDKPEKEKSLNRPRGRESKLTSKRLDKSNSLKRLLPLPSRLAWREKTICTRSKNKNRSSCKKGKSKKIESKLSSIIQARSEPRLRPTKIFQSKIDLTTWKKVEKSERKLTWREIRSRTSRQPKYQSCRKLE